MQVFCPHDSDTIRLQYCQSIFFVPTARCIKIIAQDIRPYSLCATTLKVFITFSILVVTLKSMLFLLI